MMKKDLFIRILILWGLLTGFTEIHATGDVTGPDMSSDIVYTLPIEKVTPIYGSRYNETINSFKIDDSWGGKTTPSFALTEDDFNLIKLSNFDYHPLTFYGSPADLSTAAYINIDAFFSRDVSTVGIKLYPSGDTDYEFTSNKTYKKGKWHSIQIPLNEFIRVKGDEALKKTTSILLSVQGDDVGVTAYLDNIYFSMEANEPIEIPAASTPERPSANVVNFYSTQYGTDTDLVFLDWGGKYAVSKKNDSEDNELLKFSRFNWGAIQYDLNNQVLEIGSNNRFRLNVYSENALPAFKVILMLYDNRIGNAQNIEFETQASNLAANEWHTIDVDITDFLEKTERKISTIQIHTGSSNNTIYLNHIYFYNDKDITPVESAPENMAYLPPVQLNPANVISIFSDSYANGLSTGYPEVVDKGQTTVEAIVRRGNNFFYQLTETDQFPLDLGNVDLSGMDSLHIDIYSPDATSLSITLDGGNKHSIPVTLIPGEWNRINFALSEFADVSLDDVDYLSLEDGNEKTFFIDNIYFFRKKELFTPTPIENLNKKLGKGINFGNIYDQSNLEWNDAYIAMVKEKGFTHVRLPIRWDNDGRSLNEEPYNIDEAFMLKMKTVIDKILAADLKLVINMHHYNPLMELSGEEQAKEMERFLVLWAQIAEYFQNYPEDLVFEILNEPRDNMTVALWNELLEKAINTIRVTNPNRAIMVGTTDWGTVYGLEGLKLPQDNHLILTVHYYNPMPFTHQGAEWSGNPPIGYKWYDSQSDREAVINEFNLIRDFSAANNNIPVHIGEFGTYDRADIDSRLLWTTFVTRTIDQYGYSYAYWDFGTDFGIYDVATGQFRQHLLDALFTNKIPEKPMDFHIVGSETVYDSNINKGSNWNTVSTDCWTNSWDNGVMTVSITNERVNAWDVQPFLITGIEEGAIYTVTLTVSGDTEGYTFSNYIGKSGADYIPYGPNISFSPKLQEETYSYTFTMLRETDNEARFTLDMGGQGKGHFTFKNISITKGFLAISSATIPKMSEPDVSTVFSSFYNNGLSTVAFPSMGGTIKGEEKDVKENEIIKLDNFDKQDITLGTSLVLNDKDHLHLDVYPRSGLKLVVTAGNEGTVQKYSYTLKPHTWNALDIDLTGLLAKTKGKIDNINLSCDLGGRTLYLDHIYFYKKDSGTDPSEPEEPLAPSEAAPVPTQAANRVVSIFSDTYANIPYSFDSQDGQTTEVDYVRINGNNTLRLTNTNILFINLDNVKVDHMEQLHLDVWTAETETFNLYLSDGNYETPAINMSSRGEEWKSFNILLSDYEKYINLANLYFIRMEANRQSIYYVDNLYFYSTPPTDNSVIQQGNDITYKIQGNQLLLESQIPLQSVVVFDVTGRISSNIRTTAVNVTIDLNQLNSGVHFLQVVDSEGKMKTIKFVKR